MTKWVLRGLRTGIKSTRYPDAPEPAAGVSPGRPLDTRLPGEAAAADLAALCPTVALAADGAGVAVDFGRCVHCFRCARADAPAVVRWDEGFEWGEEAAAIETARARLGAAFRRALNIRFLDAGACGACIAEARHLNSPYYNMHRLGLFVTPSPRNADILLVAGPLTDAMRLAALKTYEAMPDPKRIVAIGACAATGGVFGPSYATAGGIADMLPVDVIVPGCPPPPLAILHGLLVAIERKPPAGRSPAPQAKVGGDHA